MAVICHVTSCPYNTGVKCGKEITIIDENAMCNYVWNKGQVRSNKLKGAPNQPAQNFNSDSNTSI